MRSGCTARLWLRWWRCGCVFRLPGRVDSILRLQVARLKGRGLRLRDGSRPGRRLRSGLIRKCKGGCRVASFSGLDIRERLILMRGMHGRGTQLLLRRVLLIGLRRMVCRHGRITIQERRLRGIWATG